MNSSRFAASKGSNIKVTTENVRSNSAQNDVMSNAGEEATIEVKSEGNKGEPDKSKKGLGRWYFDKKKRKNAYLSLSGKKCFGAEAVSMSRSDKYRNTNPELSSRPELNQLMTTVTVDSLLSHVNQSNEEFEMTQNHNQARSNLFGDDAASAEHEITEAAESVACSFLKPNIYSLEFWGVPIATADKYSKLFKVSQLFPWQVDCLCCEDGFALQGGNLVYSAPTSGGKTLVSELLMLRRLGIEQHKTGKQRTMLFL